MYYGFRQKKVNIFIFVRIVGLLFILYLLLNSNFSGDFCPSCKGRLLPRNFRTVFGNDGVQSNNAIDNKENRDPSSHAIGAGAKIDDTKPFALNNNLQMPSTSTSLNKWSSSKSCKSDSTKYNYVANCNS